MKSIPAKLGVAVVTLVALWAAAYYWLQPKQSQLDLVMEKGELTVVTRNASTTFYLGAEGYTGFEYELAKGFADYLGVKLKLVVEDEFHKILPRIKNGEADLAAAGITRTPQREQELRFSQDYLNVNEQLIYRGGEKRPRSLNDIQTDPIDVVANSSHVESLKEQLQEHPFLRWRARKDQSTDQLLQSLNNNKIHYVIADSNQFRVSQRYFPKLRVAFDLGEEKPLAWAFRADGDDSLLEKANTYFSQIQEDGTFAKIYDDHFGHVEKLDYVGAITFFKHARERLPELESLFQSVAKSHDIDWKMLAAISYQESLWDPEAVSPTGVRGLMMLTRTTAEQLGVENRRDPEMSLDGGTQYLLHLKEKIPQRIPDPDRTWFALAAYNVGYGHLEDARIITQQRGGNPDLWKDVQENLPLLTQKKWYKNTKRGYARGHEPVVYVNNIRNYYDLLVWKYKDQPEQQSYFDWLKELFQTHHLPKISLQGDTTIVRA